MEKIAFYLRISIFRRTFMWQELTEFCNKYPDNILETSKSKLNQQILELKIWAILPSFLIKVRYHIANLKFKK